MIDPMQHPEVTSERIEQALQLLDPITRQKVPMSHTVMEAIRYYNEAMQNDAVDYPGKFSDRTGHRENLAYLVEECIEPDEGKAYVARDPAKAYQILKRFNDHSACYAEERGFGELMLDIIECAVTHPSYDVDPEQRGTIIIILRGVIDLHKEYQAMEAKLQAKELA